MTGFRIIIFRRWFTENNKKMFLNTNATWREWLSSESKEWKIYGLALSLQLISNVTPSFRRPRQNIAPKKGAARAARLFFLHSTNQIISLWRWRCRCRPSFLNLLNDNIFPPSNPGHDVNVVSLASLFVNMKGLLRMWRNCSAPSGESERLKD